MEPTDNDNENIKTGFKGPGQWHTQAAELENDSEETDES